MVVDPVIIVSARRHGVDDEDILHAMPARDKYLR